MTDSKQTTAKQPATKAPTNQTRPARGNAPPTKAKAASWGNRIVLWLLLIIIIAAVIVGYQNWQFQQQIGLIDALQNEVTGLQTTQNQRLQKLQQETAALNNQLIQQKNALAEQENAVDAALERAMQQLTQQQRLTHQQLPKLALAEAEYLLRLANQRLSIEQKPEKVVPLLQAADEIMRTSQQIGSFSVRKAIAKDLIALGNIKSVDSDGIYARLASLVSLTQQLRYLAPTETAAHSSQTTPTTDTHQSEDVELSLWQATQQSAVTIATATWHELKDLIRIKEREAADKILLTPDTEQLVRLRLQLLFNQSQTALLQEKPRIYLQALQQADAILQQHYRVSDAVTKSMLTTLDDLRNRSIRPSIPSISGSLAALQTLQATIEQAQE